MNGDAERVRELEAEKRTLTGTLRQLRDWAAIEAPSWIPLIDAVLAECTMSGPSDEQIQETMAARIAKLETVLRTLREWCVRKAPGWIRMIDAVLVPTDRPDGQRLDKPSAQKPV